MIRPPFKAGDSVYHTKLKMWATVSGTPVPQEFKGWKVSVRPDGFLHDVHWQCENMISKQAYDLLEATKRVACVDKPRIQHPYMVPQAAVTGQQVGPMERQEGGSHYKGLKIQPIEYIHANGIPFAEGSVIKYVTRWRDKGGLKDLEKARHFIDMLIELERKRGTA